MPTSISATDRWDRRVQSTFRCLPGIRIRSFSLITLVPPTLSPGLDGGGGIIVYSVSVGETQNGLLKCLTLSTADRSSQRTIANMKRIRGKSTVAR